MSAVGRNASSCSMVCGPMMPEVTPGWLMTKATASSISVCPAFSAKTASCSTASSLRRLAWVLMSKRAWGRAAVAGPYASVRQEYVLPALLNMHALLRVLDEKMSDDGPDA